MMAAEAAANQTASADLRSNLFIAFLPRLRKERRRKRRAHYVMNGAAKPKKRSASKRVCLPTARALLVLPERRFRHVPLRGQLTFPRSGGRCAGRVLLGH